MGKLKITIKIVLLGLLFFIFSFGTARKITIKGSDTMVILTQKWAEVYRKKNPNAVIYISGGGSSIGIDALINGTTLIANSSRPLTPEEIVKLKSKFKNYIEIPCAKDGLSVYLNVANPVTELTLTQLSDIFSGKITNWKQVGGVDAKIHLYGREDNSGTYEFFKDHVVKTEFATNCKTLSGTAAIVHAVNKDKFGIGYGGAAYAEGVRDCKVKLDKKSKGIAPSDLTIKNKTYPISRYLYMYLNEKPTGDIKKFVDWILSPEGQKVIVEVGYYPLK